MNDLAAKLVKQHEGRELKPYRCTAGYLTIGYGRNLDSRGISRDEADYLLANDLQEAVCDLSNFKWWRSLPYTAQAALVDLHHCVGPAGFRGFVKMIAALEQGNMIEAAKEVTDSKFARQTGSRADDLAGLLIRQ